MSQPALLLPAEIWNFVFGYLSTADKFSARASCKYFKKLIDHGSLWKDYWVVLGFQSYSYNSQFWSTLRRRRVTSVVVRRSKPKDWEQLSTSLPALATLVMERSSQVSLDCLKNFDHLKRLAFRSSLTPLLLGAPTVKHPHQLTHLSMCDVALPTTTMANFISVLSQFTNLTSLVCHQTGIFEETIWMVHSLLSCLPKLQHLSLSTLHILCTLHSAPRPNPGPIVGANGQAFDPVLTSFELVGCMDHSLPKDAMRLMPGLRKLALFYKHSHQDLLERWSAPGCHLKRWLRDLPHLTTLVVVKGPPVKKYCASIPATVTRLTMCVADLTSDDMIAVSKQVPNLLHLHMETWPARLGFRAGFIPVLFGKLQSLKLRHQHIPEKEFLYLHTLKDLRYLEFLDQRPDLSELLDKIRVLTKYRLHVTSSPRKRDLLSCPCVCQAY